MSFCDCPLLYLMSRRITSLHSLGTLFAKPFLSLLSRSGRAESGTPPSPLCHSLRHLLPVSPHQCVSSTRTEHRAGVLSLCCPLEWPGSGFQASVSMASSSQLITGGTQGDWPEDQQHQGHWELLGKNAESRNPGPTVSESAF